MKERERESLFNLPARDRTVIDPTATSPPPARFDWGRGGGPIRGPGGSFFP